MLYMTRTQANIILYLAINFFISTAALAQTPLNFSVVPMHYGIIKNEPMTANENMDWALFTVESVADKGDIQLILTGDTNLHPSELIAYRSISGRYYVAQVKNVTGNGVTLMSPLKEGINVGVNVWNFYSDSSHPNTLGFRAIADYAMAYLKDEKFANKIHGFAGDSWFDNDSMVPHFAAKLNAKKIINKGIGGRKTSDVLKAFDTDFPLNTTEQPDYIWVLLGTNDYWGEVPREDYIANIEQIIRKINQRGAKAIVFTASVAPYLNTRTGTLSYYHDLSIDYADDLLALDQKVNGSEEIKVSVKGDNLAIELIAPQVLNNNYHYLYFMDTDNDANTGYKTAYSQWGDAGSDYVVNDGELYQSQSNNSDWNWQYKKEALSLAKNKIVVSKNDIELSANTLMKVSVLVVSNDWNTVVDYYPKSGKMKLVNLQTTSPNTQFKAFKDTVTASSGVPITIDVLGNDTGTGLTLTSFDDPLHGNNTIVNNMLVYTADWNFSGEEDFWYEVTDINGKTKWGNVVITVGSGGNNIIGVNNDTATLHPGNTILIDVLANDSNRYIAIDDVDATWIGNISIVGNTLKYKSDPNFTGDVIIWYSAVDSNGETQWAELMIHIVP